MSNSSKIRQSILISYQKEIFLQKVTRMKYSIRNKEELLQILEQGQLKEKV